jgi:hypothetical protein
MAHIKNPVPAAIRNGAQEQTIHEQQYSTPSIERIAEQHNGRRITDGKHGPRWLVNGRCHDDQHASVVLFVGEDGGLGAYCYAGCDPKAVRDALGLTRQRTHQTRGPSLRELEREAWRHLLGRTIPSRWPPYTRQLPRRGDVFILIASDDWPKRPAPALVLPPGQPWAVYRWPVTGRRVHLIDLSTNPPPGYFHYGALPWLADPWQWQAVRRPWLRSFARALVEKWGALQVRIVSEADRAMFKQRGVRHAA